MIKMLKLITITNSRFTKLSIRFLCALLLLIIEIPITNAQTWIEDTFQDFSSGNFDASGNNIYVSQDGKIRTIHKFDYNNDGYIDLLYNQTHNSITDNPATLAEVSTNKTIKETNLAVEGSLRTTTADLNNDGYLDLIFIPNHRGIQSPRAFLTIIYGGEDGWPTQRSHGALPVYNIKSVAIADLNHDGWADIVTLNGLAWAPGQPAGNIARIYWGDKRGYLITRYYDLGIPGAIDITSGDFDKDGAVDVAFLKGDHNIAIYWATPAKETAFIPVTSNVQLPETDAQISTIAAGDCNNNNMIDLLVGTTDSTLYIIINQNGRSWGEPQKIGCFNSSNISVGDIDKDGFNDILLSFFSQRLSAGGEYGGAQEGSGGATQILWGSSNGFSRSNSTSLEAQYLSASAFGDFDGDGLNDIAISINRGAVDFETQSIIYYGKGNRKFVKGDVGIATSGAFHVHAFSVKNSKTSKLIFSNSMGGKIGERVPLYLYWGGQNGFSEKNRTEIPFRSGYEATSADFNADGNTDIVVLDEMHGGQTLDEDPWAGANIFWGKTGNIDFNSRSVLTESELGSSNTADLNKDGYLDLVLGHFGNSSIIVYYGTKSGFNSGHRDTIPCSGGSLGIQLADYNRDSWLDIAVASFGESVVRVFYGSANGFDISRKGEVDVPSAIDLETADINKDGWLDIIACSYSDAINYHFDMGLFIFWGSQRGFNHADAQWLPASAPLGPVVADFDNDGYLDLFAPSYHGDDTRENLPCYFYWGGLNGFRIQNRTTLINNSAGDGIAADFDKDGRLDLAVSNHARDENHNTFSKIYYNDGNRFENPRIEKLPTFGAHWSLNEDMGHIYDRSWRQTYESSVFQWDKNRTQGKIDYLAEIPKGTQLLFEVRSFIRKTGLSDEKWMRVENSGQFEVNTANRFLQYRVIFVSDNGDSFPVLDKVVIELSK
jgi:hypothetical protein